MNVKFKNKLHIWAIWLNITPLAYIWEVGLLFKRILHLEDSSLGGGLFSGGGRGIFGGGAVEVWHGIIFIILQLTWTQPIYFLDRVLLLLVENLFITSVTIPNGTFLTHPQLLSFSTQKHVSVGSCHFLKFPWNAVVKECTIPFKIFPCTFIQLS